MSTAQTVGRGTTRRAYAIAYLTEVEIGPEIVEYIERIESTFEPYGGEWVVHGAEPEVLEGELPGGVVIIGFPSREHARDWYRSDAYRAILPLRTEHARSITLLVDGVPPGYRAADTAAKLASLP